MARKGFVGTSPHPHPEEPFSISGKSEIEAASRRTRVRKILKKRVSSSFETASSKPPQCLAEKGAKKVE